MGFDQLKNTWTLDDAQSPKKEPMEGMTQVRHIALITHQEDSILDSNNHSTNKTPTNEDTATETNPTIQPHRLAQFRIPVKTSKEGVAVLPCGLVSYLKSSLNVAHAIQDWTYYAHILPGSNLSFFPALTEDIIQDFIDRMDGKYANIILSSCNPKSREISSKKSAVFAYNYIHSRIWQEEGDGKMELYIPNVGYIDSYTIDWEIEKLKEQAGLKPKNILKKERDNLDELICYLFND